MYKIPCVMGFQSSDILHDIICFRNHGKPMLWIPTRQRMVASVIMLALDRTNRCLCLTQYEDYDIIIPSPSS